MAEKEKVTAVAEPKPLPDVVVPAPAPAAIAVIKTVEQHCIDAGTPKWQFEAAKIKFFWVQNRELTRNQYDIAIQAAGQEMLQ